MPGGGYCAVYGCSNSWRNKERNIVKDHVGILRFHQPRSEKDQKKWEKMLNRGGNFTVSHSTKVCSNHFTAGYCSDICSVPTLYLKGYKEDSSTPRRQSPRKRLLFSPENPPPKRVRNVNRQGFHSKNEISNVVIVPSPHEDHAYEVTDENTCSRCKPFQFCDHCRKQNKLITELRQQLKLKDDENLALKTNLEKLQSEAANSRRFSYDEIKGDDNQIKFYTGLQNTDVFNWLSNRLAERGEKLQYFQGEKSFTPKSYQLKKRNKKSGKKSVLCRDDCLLLTLMRLRVGMPEKDLAYRFKISQFLVSRILFTWIRFLSEEMSSFIYWPSRENILQYYPACFKNFKNVVGIIDCTEGILEKPSAAKAQSQTYSTYKSRNTWKKLICITPAGTVSFISKSYGGCASDRYITENCGLLNFIEYGDNIMADKGFNISDLLISKGSQLIIPPFLREVGRFTRKDCKKTSNIAKARIHVERAIARIKDFRILHGAFPLSLKDLLDDIFVICAAATNLAPALVPLSK